MPDVLSQTCERCRGTGDIEIHEQAVGINAGIGIPYGEWLPYEPGFRGPKSPQRRAKASRKAVTS